MELDGTTFEGKNEPLDLPQVHAAGSTEELTTTSCEELHKTANTYMERVIENFPACTHNGHRYRYTYTPYGKVISLEELGVRLPWI